MVVNDALFANTIRVKSQLRNEMLMVHAKKGVNTIHNALEICHRATRMVMRADAHELLKRSDYGHVIHGEVEELMKRRRGIEAHGSRWTFFCIVSIDGFTADSRLQTRDLTLKVKCNGGEITRLGWVPVKSIVADI